MRCGRPRQRRTGRQVPRSTHRSTGTPRPARHGPPRAVTARPGPRPLTASAVQLLQARLGLSDEELCVVLEADPLTLIGGELEHRPELPILLALTAEPAERVGETTLARWLRTSGPAGRPLDLLLAREFGAFEDALGTLAERGFVIRRGPP